MIGSAHDGRRITALNDVMKSYAPDLPLGPAPANCISGLTIKGSLKLG